MANQSNDNILQFGRVLYVEPNNNVKGTGKGTNFTFNPEDYSILVDLQVDVVDRYAYYGSGTREEIQYTLEWDAKGTKTSMFKGTNGLLTTRAMDTSFDEIINNYNQEAIGINSIDIKYNSWNYPEITIQFTDIRGAALLSSADYIHSPLAGNANKAKFADNFANSFFATFFRFPYPRYTLIVKGFYGRPVSYTLCVNDFKTKFNSGTGNFDVTVSFIGYMYGLLTDIPMRLLFAAPYNEYPGGQDYWATQTDQNKEFRFHYRETKTPMYTFFELNENIKQINKRLPKLKEFQEVVEKEKKLQAKKTGLQEIQNIYNTYLASFNSESNNKKASREYRVEPVKTSGEMAEGVEYEGRKYVILFSGSANVIKKGCPNCGGSGKVPENYTASSNYGVTTVTHTKECPVCKGTGKGERTLGETDGVEVCTNTDTRTTLYNEIVKYNDVPENSESKVVFIPRIDSPENCGKPLRGTIVYRQKSKDEESETEPVFEYLEQDLDGKNIFHDVKDEDRDSIIDYLKNGEGLTTAKQIAADTKCNSVAVAVLFVSDFENSVGIGLNGIDDKIKEAAEEVKKQQEMVFTKLLGFKVTLKNVIDMCLAHLDTFMHSMYKCMGIIKDKSSERNLSRAKINLNETDLVATTENLFLPPFFAFRKKNPKTEEYEDQWLEDDIRFSNRELFQEIKLIDGLLNGTLKAEGDAKAKAEKFLANKAVEEFGPTLGTDYLPTFINDYLVKKNPYDKAYGNFENLIATFAFRCMLASIYVIDYPTIGSRFDSMNNKKKQRLFEVLGDNDARNFALKRDDFEKFWKNTVEFSKFELLTWDNFRDYILGKKDGKIVLEENGHIYFSGNMTSPLFTRQGTDNYLISYGNKESGKYVVPLYFDTAGSAVSTCNDIYEKSNTTSATPNTNGLGISRDYAMPVVTVSESDSEFFSDRDKIQEAFGNLETPISNIGWYVKNEENWKKYFSGAPRGLDNLYWFPTVVLKEHLSISDVDEDTGAVNNKGNIYDGQTPEAGKTIYAYAPTDEWTDLKGFFTGGNWFERVWKWMGGNLGNRAVKAGDNTDSYVEKTVVPRIMEEDSCTTVYALPCGEGTLFESEFYLIQNNNRSIGQYSGKDANTLRKAFLFLHSLPSSEYGALGNVVSTIIKRTYMPSVTDIPYASALFIGALYFREKVCNGGEDNFISYGTRYKAANSKQLITYSVFQHRVNGDDVRRPLHPIKKDATLNYKDVVNAGLQTTINGIEKNSATNRFDNDLRRFIEGKYTDDAFYCGFWDVKDETKEQFIKLFTTWALSNFSSIDNELSLKKRNGELFSPNDILRFRKIIRDKVFKKPLFGNEYKAGRNEYGIPVDKTYNDFVRETFHDSFFKNHDKVGASLEYNALITMFKKNAPAVEQINKLLFNGSTVTIAFPRVLMTRDMFSPDWDKERNALRTDEDSLQAAWKAFHNGIVSAANGAKEKQEKDEETVRDNPPASVSSEVKLSLYETLKNLHDKWLIATNENKYMFSPDSTVTVSNVSGRHKGIADNFFYINTFYEDVGDEITLNIEELPKQIQTVIESFDDACSLYSFMYDVANQARTQLLALPIFNDLSNPSYVQQMFTPIPYDEINFEELNTETQYIFLYPEEASKNLILPSDSDDADERYKFSDDSFTLVTEAGLENTVNVPVTFNKTKDPVTQEEMKKVPVMGVTFAKQNQSFFKNISVSMDSPKTTEVSIENMLMVANRFNGGNNQITALGQDLFPIYSNYSYECMVEMMGCGCIMPLMYFQLNNIPMFKGTYIIYNVSHTISPGNMTTTFSGQRLSRYRKKRNENALSSAPNDEALSSQGFYKAYDINGNCTNCYTPSNHKLDNEEVYQEMANKTGVSKEALRAVEYAETHYTGGFFAPGKLKVYYDPWVAGRNGVSGSGLSVPTQFDTSYAMPNNYEGNIEKIESAKAALGGNESASAFTITGAFGIPGQCYGSCGASSLKVFYDNCGEGFANQGNYFAALLNKKTEMRDALKNKDWKKFAKLYKGAGGATTTGVFCPGDDENFSKYAKDLEAGYNDADSASKENADTYIPSEGEDLHITEPGFNPHASTSNTYANQHPLNVRNAVNTLNANAKIVHYIGEAGCNKVNTTGKDQNGNYYTKTINKKKVRLIDTETHIKNPGSKPADWSLSLCASYVKCALKAGGYPYIGCDGGNCADEVLEPNGFEEIYRSKPGEPWSGSSIDSKWQPGDVMTIAPFTGKKEYKWGHIAMWNGKNWVSDFVQGSCVCYTGDAEAAKDNWNRGGYRFFRYRNRINM